MESLPTVDIALSPEHDTPASRIDSVSVQASAKVLLTVSIDGMTCAACPAGISRALSQMSFVEALTVSLLNRSATLTAPHDKVKEIIETIEDTGYDAQIVSIRRLDPPKIEAGLRQIQVQVSDGDWHDTVLTLKRALQDLSWVQKLELTDSVHDHITINYRPVPPHQTVRALFEIIASLGLHVKVYEPPLMSDIADQKADIEIRKYLMCILCTLLAAIPTFIIGICIMDLLPEHSGLRQFFMAPVHGRFSRGVLAMFILATPIEFGIAIVFHKPAIKGIRGLWRGRHNSASIGKRLFRFGSMSLLVSLGVTIAYFASLALLIVSATEVYVDSTEDTTYFDSVVFLCLFILIGRYLEASSKKKMKNAVRLLSRLKPCEALLVRESGNTWISATLLEIGDQYVVPVGASPPVDGMVIDQETFFDESSFSGESRPVKKGLGDMAFSGTINIGRQVIMEATNINGSNVLDSIIKVVADGSAHRAPIERLGDILTAYFVPLVCLISVIVFVIWLGLAYSEAIHTTLSPTLFALRFSISVFVIACPCGIGLAAPTASAVGSGMCAKLGILASGGSEAFSDASEVRAVVFDKTGTITLGQMQVIGCELSPSLRLSHRELILASIAALEQSSTHPISKALTCWTQDYIAEHSLKTASFTIQEVQELPGQGLRGSICTGGELYHVLIGNESLMLSYGMAPWKAFSSMLMSNTLVYVATKASSDVTFEYGLVLSISDPIREEAQAVVAQLRKQEISCYLLTGDNPLVAHQVAKLIGIDSENVMASVLPVEKQEHLLRLKAHYAKSGKVAMVGDGINDAAALAAADVSVSLSSATDIAMSSASFILVNSDLRSILKLLRLSSLIYRRIQFNFAWAIIFNIIAIPIAAGVLYPHRQFILSPAWSSLAMALSSISVVLSSFALLLHRTSYIKSGQ